jgi:CRP/FNR family cyclic AMP-dependent transcriptional regulator
VEQPRKAWPKSHGGCEFPEEITMAKTNLFRSAENFETYEAGQLIFEEGHPGDVLYVIKEGEVEILVGARVVETLEAGEIFGEMALIEHKGRSASARAKSACSVVPVSEQRFSFLVQQTPHFAISVMQTMAERLRNMNARGQ